MLLDHLVEWEEERDERLRAAILKVDFEWRRRAETAAGQLRSGG